MKEKDRSIPFALIGPTLWFAFLWLAHHLHKLWPAVVGTVILIATLFIVAIISPEPEWAKKDTRR